MSLSLTVFASGAGVGVAAAGVVVATGATATVVDGLDSLLFVLLLVKRISKQTSKLYYLLDKLICLLVRFLILI